ncbi:3-oxoacyl-ACP synthase III family protein [Ruegeria arenilitoris]|uniref:3-oxoacyl-ACP synthase III family protein n=1 Tax=Ruegeria arenilitoris TaxID=1173585 RepID=UPI00147D082B|nr:ketoacyl-ACP synthase III [Ruegeria arenilitoris]
MKVSVLGTGRSLPTQSLQSSAIDFDLGLVDRVSSTGVKRRFVCRDEDQIDLAKAAGLAALENAGLSVGDIDLVISGSSVPFQPIPSTAPLIMRELGITDGTAAAFDINSTCLSFVSALEAAARMIEGGAAKRALVISSEIASRALPWDDQPEVAALFGDGAAAVVLGPSGDGAPSEIKAIRLRSFPSAYEACHIGAGGTRFDFETDHQAFVANAKFGMNGKELFRLTSQHFNTFMGDLLKQAGWARSDVDLVIPHQASPAGLDHMIRQTGFDRDRVVRIVEDYGNQIAASIPFALDIAREKGLLAEGSRVLMLGTSAGVSFGGAALVI